MQMSETTTLLSSFSRPRHVTLRLCSICARCVRFCIASLMRVDLHSKEDSPTGRILTTP
jgi:hypothetical protein